MAFMNNREFAEHLFNQEKRNAYTDALVREVRRLREEMAEREKGCPVCDGKYADERVSDRYCNCCGKRLEVEP